jgi:DNA-binding IclR family transcriptional regulator
VRVFLDTRSVSLPFSQIRDTAGLQPATAHRLLSDLVEHGWLAQREDRSEYSLGPLLLSCGLLATDGLTYRTVAEPHVNRLRDERGETVVVAELQGDQVVPVVRADGLFEMRMNQQLGVMYPAYAGATGKLLLAYLEPASLERYLAEVTLRPLTGRTVLDRDELRSQLEIIRKHGVSVSRGERVDDAVAVSAPLRDRTGRVVAAVTVSGVASRFDRDVLEATVQATRECAGAISRELGWDSPSPDAGGHGIDRLYDGVLLERVSSTVSDGRT